MSGDLSRATLFQISQACTWLRAGFGLRLAGKGKQPALFSLDFVPRPLLERLISTDGAQLILSAERVTSIGHKDLVLSLGNPEAIGVPIDKKTPMSVLFQLAQANPETLGAISAQVFSDATVISDDYLNYLKLSQSLPAGVLIDPAIEVDDAATAPLLDPNRFHAALANTLEQVGATPIPLDNIGDTRMHLFRDCFGDESHLAIEVGKRPKAIVGQEEEPILVRVHSSCVTGDIFHSQRCDCGHQLMAALAAMRDRGYGVLVYLSQEGRGIGLNNKLKSYLLQQAGLDTVDGNLALGFQDDERDFAYAARILALMGAEKIELLTNNPNKISQLDMDGIDIVKRVPLVEIHNETAANYVATKALKSGHLI